jgi:hypothetical protein
MILSQEASEQQKFIRSAKLPLVHRYRYPQSVLLYLSSSPIDFFFRIIDQGFPHLQPLGSGVDLSDLVVKSGLE